MQLYYFERRYYMKRFLAVICVVSLIVCSVSLPVCAAEIQEADTTFEPAAVQPRASYTYTIPSGSPVTVNVGSFSVGDWVQFDISRNSASIPVTAQLMASGKNYTAYSFTTGTRWWQISTTGTHYIYFYNSNNYSTSITFYVYGS